MGLNKASAHFLRKIIKVERTKHRLGSERGEGWTYYEMQQIEGSCGEIWTKTEQLLCSCSTFSLWGFSLCSRRRTHEIKMAAESRARACNNISTVQRVSTTDFR